MPKVGSSHEYSNLAHFETVDDIDESTDQVRTIEIEPLQGYAIVIDGVRATFQGLEDEESSQSIYCMVSVDENQAAYDPDDEDTIAEFVMSKDRTTTGISMCVMSDHVVFNRGIPTDSRALRLIYGSDVVPQPHKLQVTVEYHYEKYNSGMRLQRGL